MNSCVESAVHLDIISGEKRNGKKERKKGKTERKKDSKKETNKQKTPPPEKTWGE